MITQEYLKSILDYDPDTGLFTRKVRTSKRIQVGDVAGTEYKNGYVYICADGKHYLSHRLAFIWMTGSCPEYVDHINRNQSDNRWCNLRSATASQNRMNSRSRKGSSSKYLGVYWHKHDEKWHAQIRVNGGRKHLGSFSCEIEAAKAYDGAAKEYFGDFANLNFGDFPK